MITVSIISVIIGGGRLALSAAQYLESINSKWRQEAVLEKLDSIRDCSLKAGLRFLKDAALSKNEDNAKSSLDKAYHELVKASSVYSDKFESAMSSAIGVANIEGLKVSSCDFLSRTWNKGVDKFGNAGNLSQKAQSDEEETNKLCIALDALAFCHLCRNEKRLSAECLAKIFNIKVKFPWTLYRQYADVVSTMGGMALNSLSRTWARLIFDYAIDNQLIIESIELLNSKDLLDSRSLAKHLECKKFALNNIPEYIKRNDFDRS